jgi:hypothetical protein
MPRITQLGLALLAVVQISALSWQFVDGFGLFLNEPRRVPFSWDMFSNPVERCTLNWLPALHVENQTLAKLRDLTLPIEWDVVYDSIDDYKAIGAYMCAHHAAAPTRVNFHCYLHNGSELRDEFSCP